MQLRLATKADEPFLQNLWQEAFGDTKETIQQFFDACFLKHTALLAELEGEPVSALYLLDTTLQNGAETYALSYVYAAATRTAARGKGVMTALLEFAKRQATLQGTDALYLVPADKTLYTYYGSRGYAPAFLKEEISLSKKDWQMPSDVQQKTAPPCVAQYEKHRAEALKALPHMVYPPQILHVSLQFMKPFGETLSLLPSGFYVVQEEKPDCIVSEFCPKEGRAEELLLALFSQQTADHFILHAPCGTAKALRTQNVQTRAAGMVYPLSERFKKEYAKDTYLGITLG